MYGGDEGPTVAGLFDGKRVHGDNEGARVDGITEGTADAFVETLDSKKKFSILLLTVGIFF